METKTCVECGKDYIGEHCNECGNNECGNRASL